MSLDPADDASFTLAHLLGPFATTVSAMSMDGKLVCDATADDWRWRLTSIEHAELGQHLIPMVPRSRLVRLPKPQRPEADLPWPTVIIGVTVGSEAIKRGLDGLHHWAWNLSTCPAVLSLTVGLAMIALGVDSLARAGRRRLAHPASRSSRS